MGKIFGRSLSLFFQIKETMVRIEWKDLDVPLTIIHVCIVIVIVAYQLNVMFQTSAIIN